MLCGSFSFSWMIVLVHEVGKSLDWQVIMVARCAIPLVIVGAWCLARGISLVFLRPAVLWIRSLAGSLSMMGTFFVLPQLPPSDVATISNVFPIWVALLSWPLLGQMPSGKVWLSVFCGVLGVALIQQPHLEKGNFAVLIVVGVSLFTALAMLGLHHLQDIDPRAIVVHFSFVSLLFALAACLLFERPMGWAGLTDGVCWWQLLGVGFTATIGQIFLTLAFTHGEPARVSVVGLTQIVFTLIIDAVVLEHWPEPKTFLGVPLILGPTAWLMWHQQKDHGLEMELDLEDIPSS